MKLALERYNLMMESLPKKYSNSSWLLHGLLSQAVENNKEANKSFIKAMNLDDIAKTFLKNSQEIVLELFPNMNRLCVSFPFVDISFKNHPSLVL